MNMARVNSKNIAFTVPPVMAEEFERLAEEEQSTKSELFRRMFRFYQASRKITQKQQTSENEFNAKVEKVIFETTEKDKKTLKNK